MNLQQRIAMLAADLGIEKDSNPDNAPEIQLNDLVSGCGLKLVCADQVKRRNHSVLEAVYVMSSCGRAADEMYIIGGWCHEAGPDPGMPTITEMYQRANGCVVIKMSSGPEVVFPKHRIVALRYVSKEQDNG